MGQGLQQEQLERALISREEERRRALVSDDMTSLAELMRDDLVHVHNSGVVHGKAELLEHAGKTIRFLDVTRGPLTIRSISPTAAIMTGSMTNTAARRGQDERVIIHAFVTQIWVWDEAAWRIASFQATRLPTA